MRILWIAFLALLFVACGVSPSKQREMSDTFRNKLQMRYLKPDAPGMIEEVELSDFEKGGSLGDFQAHFSAVFVSDERRRFLISGVVGFDETGLVAWEDSVHWAVVVTAIRGESWADSVGDWNGYLVPEIY